MIAAQQNTLVIGNHQYNANKLRVKLEEDVVFIMERIARYQQQAHPNPNSLAAYENMLESREMILKWLNKRVSLTE